MPATGVEYATDQITVYRECPYGCRYCYATKLGFFKHRIQRGGYNPVEEAKAYLRVAHHSVLLSFTSDPYPPAERVNQRTSRVLRVLAQNPTNRILILTKNPMLFLERDIHIAHKDLWVGTTIVSLDKTYLEPNAPPPKERLKALKTLKELGFKTWISLEPLLPSHLNDGYYPTELVEHTKDFADWYVLGSFNYPKQLGFAGIEPKYLRQWYKDFVPPAIKRLKELKIPFFIKRELRRYLGIDTGVW